MTQRKEELGGTVFLSLAVKTADGVLAQDAKVKMSADSEVEAIDTNYDEVHGFVKVANTEASGNATIAMTGKKLSTETTGEAYLVGSKLAFNSAGKTIKAALTRATGSFTIVDFSSMATSTITVNSVVLTNGTDFTAATSNAATAKLLAIAINAQVPGVHASANAEVVTVEALDGGIAGNAVAIAKSAADGVVTILGAAATSPTTLAGGKEFCAFGFAVEASSGADQSKKVLWY